MSDSKQLVTCEAIHSHDGFRPHTLYVGCVNPRPVDSPAPQATPEPATCKMCGRPIATANAAVASGFLRQYPDYFCSCLRSLGSTTPRRSKRESIHHDNCRGCALERADENEQE